MDKRADQSRTYFLYVLVAVIILESGAFLSFNFWQTWRLEDFRSRISARGDILAALEDSCENISHSQGHNEIEHHRSVRQAPTIIDFMKSLLEAQQKALLAVCATRPDLCINGPRGLSGQTGPVGPRGESGNTGMKGLKGDIGATGPPGQKGDSGIRGPKGPKGLTGASGDRGAQGPKGQPGTGGLKGEPGHRGNNGTTGSPGDKGAAGANGQVGLKGQKGEPGIVGETGLEGLPGTKGVPGATGVNGRLLHAECECLNEYQVLGNYSRTINVPFGAPLALHCNFNKPGIPVTWTKDGSPISKRGVATGGDLIFEQALTTDGGTYRCSGPDGILGSLSKPVTVNVGQVFKYDCDFESPCSWKDITDITKDNLDWTHNKGKTPTLGTGPLTDHTLENVNGNYIYLETSAGAPGFHAMLISEPLSANHHFCLTFWYHMSGVNMGQLEVRIQRGGSIFNPVWTMKGSQGDKWHLAKVDLFAQSVAYYAILNAVRGSTYYGDIAVDDIILLDGVCPP